MSDVMTEVTVHGRLAQLVAINAGDHGDVLFLPQKIPVIHRAVTNRAGHAGIDVLLVIEENKVGERVHSIPRKKVVVGLHLGQLPDRWAIGLDTLMTSHTVGDSGDLHLAVGSRGLMARVAFHSSLNMLPVTEGDRLRNRPGWRGKIPGLMPRTGPNRSLLSPESFSCRTPSFGEQGVRRQDSRSSGVRI